MNKIKCPECEKIFSNSFILNRKKDEVGYFYVCDNKNDCACVISPEGDSFLCYNKLIARREMLLIIQKQRKHKYLMTRFL